MFLLLFSIVSIPIMAEQDKNNISFKSYFNKGFGVLIKEKSFIKKINISKEKTKQCSYPRYILYKSLFDIRHNNGLEIHCNEALKRKLDSVHIVYNSDFIYVKVVGYENFKSYGLPKSTEKNKFPFVIQGKQWQIKHYFMLSSIGDIK